MQTRKNVLLLFSKYPHAGLVKTRLSVLKDGVFTPEDAAELYECMLLDVVDICMSGFAALDKLAAVGVKAASEGRDTSGTIDKTDTYELVISIPSEDDAKLMKTLIENNAPEGDIPYPISYIVDIGASFDEHYNDAFTQVWDLGADTILSMGADMPALTTKDIVGGFLTLQDIDENNGQGIVLSPDQEMGVSIIGWTSDTNFDHTGVFYNQDGLTVLPAYIAKAKESDLPAYYLPPVPDVDTMRDLMHNVTLVEALMYCCKFDNGIAAKRTWNKFVDLGIEEIRIMPNDLHDPRTEIDK